MAEPGQHEASGKASGSAVRIEATPVVEGEGGIKTGSLTIFTEYHVLTSGKVVFGSREEALEEEQGAKDTLTKI